MQQSHRLPYRDPPPNHSQSDFGAAASVQEDHTKQQPDGATQLRHQGRPISKYNDVRVLLLQWEDDDLGVDPEVEKLEKLLSSSRGFNFFTRRWSIPSFGDDEDPEELLSRQCYKFRKEATKDDLLILYYAGHSDNSSEKCAWAANRKRDSPTLNWYNVESILLGHNADVLLILDCCYASLAARNHKIGNNWIFAASARESPAIGVGWNSFTSTLTRRLERAADRYWRMGETTSVQSLHSNMIQWDRDLMSTPISAGLSDEDPPSPELTPLYPRDRPRLQSAKTDPSPQPKFEPSSAPVIPQLRSNATLPPDTQTKAPARQESPTLGVPFELSTGEAQTIRVYNLPPNMSELQISQWFESGLGASSVVSKIGPIHWHSSSSSMSRAITFTSIYFANQAKSIRRNELPRMLFDHAFEGLTSIYDNTQNHSMESTVDIVLVHGAHGHAINSFACHYLEPSREVLWPRDSLAKELEIAGIFPRIMTYGWKALDCLSPRCDFSKANEDLTKALHRMRADIPKRRLILIGHGIGGFLVKIYVKEAINSLVMYDENCENPILACFFLAVPQPLNDMDMEFAKCLASMDSVLQSGSAPNEEQVRQFQPCVRAIYNISQEFNMISKDWSVGHSRFRELLDTAGHTVVPEYLVNSQPYHHENLVGVNADHKGIANLKDLGASRLVVDIIRKTVCNKLGFGSLDAAAQSTEFLKSRPADKEKVFAKLRDYDTRFLVDDSSSMVGPRWNTTKHVMAKIASIAVQYDKDGVDVRFFNKKGTFMNLNTTEKVMRLFDGYRPYGGTPTAAKLKMELDEYVREFEGDNYRKGLNLIVLTDGEPQPGQNVEAVVVEYARRLAALGAPLLQVGVQFVQIGDDAYAAEFLKRLDNDLKGEYRLDRDVCWIIIVP